MFKNKTIAVVVPAHNEEKLIHKVLQTLPEWVDQVIVVDDYSTDNTSEVVRRHMKEDPRVCLIKHTENKGVGAAQPGMTYQTVSNSQQAFKHLPALPG